MKKGIRIVSSANFKRDLSRYLRETTADSAPIFVTINGNGSHVLLHIDDYNHLIQCEEYIENNGIHLEEDAGENQTEDGTGQSEEEDELPFN